MRKVTSRMFAPTFCSNATAAAAVPPVASRSSINNTRLPDFTASVWMAMVFRAVFQVVFRARMFYRAACPGLRTGTKPAPQLDGGGGGKDEPARIDAHHGVHRSGWKFCVSKSMLPANKPRVGQHRRDVLSTGCRGLGKSGTFADGAAEVGGSHGGVAHGDYFFCASSFSIIRRSFLRAEFWICRTRSRVTAEFHAHLLQRFSPCRVQTEPGAEDGGFARVQGLDHFLQHADDRSCPRAVRRG